MKIYTCICGKTFTDPQKFNGHKQGCEAHIISKYGSLEAYYLIKNRSEQLGGETRKKKSQEKQMLQLQQWISEGHTCEKCGKVMTEKYGSGKFCCKSCANSHQKSAESKEKTRASLIQYNLDTTSLSKQHSIDLQATYELNPKLCVICGKALSYKQRDRQTCSSHCYSQLRSSIRLGIIKNEGLALSRLNKRYKYGFYKGIHCDSSWELAFLVYVLETYTVDIARSTEWFPYIYKNETHFYNPDFVINGVYIEIKNYCTDQVQAKINCFPKDKDLRVLYKKDIMVCIKYCIKKYGKKFWEVLYDKDKPSCNSSNC